MLLDIRRKGLIGALIGHAVLLAVLIIVVTKSDLATNQVISGWLQAIGSVLAIVFAVIVANTQYLRQVEEKVSDKAEQYWKLARYADYVSGSVRESFTYLSGAGDPKQTDFDRHVRLLESSLEILRSVSFDSIHGAKLAIQWVQLSHNLEDYIQHAKSDPQVLMVRQTRLDNMRRGRDRIDKVIVHIRKLEVSYLSLEDLRSYGCDIDSTGL